MAADILARAWSKVWPYMLAVTAGLLVGSWVTAAIAGWL